MSQRSAPAEIDTPLPELGLPRRRLSSACEDLSGQVLAGKYRLLHPLGEGGMGAVWLARNEALEIDVAVKLIRPEVLAPEMTQRLLQEARAAASIEHGSIVRVFDFGETPAGEPFFVMEVLRGESLGALIDRTGRIAATTAVRILLPVAAALAAAHARGVVHRDLKPDNIMLVPTDAGMVPKVVDFGIAKLRREDFSSKVTGPGVAVGSPDYMSPEQAAGRGGIDERADVWALSVLLYEMLTGRLPFTGANYNDLMTAILCDEPPTTVELAAGDAELWEIVRKGLAKARDHRWSTMRKLGTALAEWVYARGQESDITGASIAAHWLGEGNEAPRMRRGSAPELSTMPPDDESGVARVSRVRFASSGAPRALGSSPELERARRSSEGGEPAAPARRGGALLAVGATALAAGVAIAWGVLRSPGATVAPTAQAPAVTAPASQPAASVSPPTTPSAPPPSAAASAPPPAPTAPPRAAKARVAGQREGAAAPPAPKRAAAGPPAIPSEPGF